MKAERAPAGRRMRKWKQSTKSAWRPTDGLANAHAWLRSYQHFWSAGFDHR